MKKNLTCPVRGELHGKETDNLDEFTEEYRRIECVRFLLEKGYPKENIDFEREIIKYGHSGRNALRADVVVYKVDKASINTNEDKIDNIILVAEIKKKSKDKESAIKYQLKPTFNQLKNCLYGIYWDDENRIFFTKESEEENSLLKLPFYGESFLQRSLYFNDLKVITNSKKLLEMIEQKIHNLGATNKDFRYKEIFKIFLSKFYDEIQNKDGRLKFQFFYKEKNNELYKRITRLYKEAYIYYSSNTPIKLETSFYLSESILKECVLLLQDYSLIQTHQLVLQEFFMYFAPILLRKELDQYYTPQELVDFMVESIELSSTSTVIDPCGGSGDFLVGMLKKALFQNINNVKQNIHYWDISQDASNIASLNMILNGDGRSHIKVIDSLEKYQFQNSHFSVCITNPPFGTNTKWEKDINTMKKYDLGKRQGVLVQQELGILFIERCINLLRENGILSIVLPTGYLTNPSYKYIRDFLISNGRIIGIISLPEGVFKKSNAGGFTTILFFKKEKIKGNYNIFIDIANKIGFDPTKKNTPKIFKRDKKNGNFILDENNKKIVDNDFIIIQEKFKKFCFKNNILGMEKENLSVDYCFTDLSTFVKDENLILCPKRYSHPYKTLLSNIQIHAYATLKDINGLVENERSFKKERSKEYIYLEIKDIFNGMYKKENILMGWQLPNRAKIGLKKYDILISKIRGCFNKFCMILEDNKYFVATNGFYRIRIKNEKDRLNFYSFLFTDNYKQQMECLSTGTILADVKKDDVLNKLYFNVHTREENYMKMKNLITCLESLYFCK